MRVLKHICFLTGFSVIFAVCFVACSNEKQAGSNLQKGEKTKISNANTNEFDVAGFERNRELWTSKNIQNYKIIIGAEGLLINFPEEVLIEVRNSRAASIKSLSKTGRNYTEGYKPYDTIEKLFALIEDAKKRNAESLFVRYDETFGYPARIYYEQSTKMSDDELLITVKDFEITR